MLKRCIDFILVCIGLPFMLPLFPLIAFGIKLDSKGPVLYHCQRVGKDGKLFTMYKFRTMYAYGPASSVGASVSPQGDPRVTPFGRFLRRTKLNELPQLLNVLKGEMTFVGPRPEAPDLAALYPAHARAIFTVTPGLVGPNQILGRNEEEWYPDGVDPQRYYITEILPKKLPLDLEYVNQSSFVKDVHYLVLGIRETLFKAISWKLVLQNKSQLYLLGADLLLSICSFGIAHLLRFEGMGETRILADSLSLLSIMVLIRLLCFFYFGLYRTLIRHISSIDLWNVFKGIATSSILFLSLTFLGNMRTFSRAVWLIDGLCLFVLMTALRLGLRLFRRWQRRAHKAMETKRRVFIFGAGHAGALAYDFLQASSVPYEVIGFLDDNPAKRYKTLGGSKVLGNRYNIETLAQLYQPHEMVLAMPNAAAHDIAAIIHACQHAAVPYRFFPTPPEEYSSQFATSWCKTHDVPLSTHAALADIITGKRVMVVGSSGALGVELCQHILHFSPERLVVLERSEPSLTALMAQLQANVPTASVTPILCAPAGTITLETVFTEHRPHVVVQNAMRKYPPFFSFQTANVLLANYVHTFALAQQAAWCDCTHFVLVSSEEAQREDTVIARSLRAAEICVRTFFASLPTHGVIVRVGDILEHRAGIVARLEERIANREPVVVPYPDMQCVLLSKNATVHCILDALGLTESLAPTEGIVVCPQAAVSVLDLARQLAALHGYQLGSDIPLDVSHASIAASPWDEVFMPYAHTSLLPTFNPSLSLFPEYPVTSPAMVAAVQVLLNLQESDVTGDSWEHPTALLLEHAAQTSHVPA